MTKKLTKICVDIVEDDPVFTKMLKGAVSQNDSFEITTWKSAEPFLDSIKDKAKSEILIVDYNLPKINGLDLLEQVKNVKAGLKCVVISGQEDVEVVVKAYKSGADDYIIKNEHCFPELMNTLKNFSKNIELEREVKALKNKFVNNNDIKIVGESKATDLIKKLIEKIAKTDLLVLITGESGVGKDLVAKKIHMESNRANAPYVPINMAAIPSELLESELFGHEKGAFTGAQNTRKGKFEEAQGGTLFLDEIAEMDLSAQARLLRVLEEKIITKLGGNKQVKLDLRILTATNKNLLDEVKRGKFREDLYYRLQGFTMSIPPLRERIEDILLLASYFADRFFINNNIQPFDFDNEAIKKIKKYSWPGNVRELKSAVERAIVLSDQKVIRSEDLQIVSSNSNMSFADMNSTYTMEDHKQNILERYLREYNNDVDKVAEKLEIGRATIYRMLKKKNDR